MPDTITLTARERQTIRAALLFWREENVPHPGVQVFYFDVPDPNPLSADEVDELRSRLNLPAP
ncbi:MAG: hypothetical protein IT428_03655 [Planctomycetaceae bacterium]|nr:hypothetical protein [Planctomycetaceae bacterium]